MKRVLLLFFLLLPLGTVAEGQTLKHNFSGDRAVYLDFVKIEQMEGTVLLTMEIEGRACENYYESIVKIDGRKIQFKGGTTWEMIPVNTRQMRIDFPRPDSSGEISVMYERAQIDPKKLCLQGRDL